MSANVLIWVYQFGQRLAHGTHLKSFSFDSVLKNRQINIPVLHSSGLFSEKPNL